MGGRKGGRRGRREREEGGGKEKGRKDRREGGCGKKGGRKERLKRERKQRREWAGRTEVSRKGRADALAGVLSTNGYEWEPENC